MATKNEIQDLLRFLAQDAKVPLPLAMSKVKDLQAANLSSPELLSKSSITSIKPIFEDEKQAKAILLAAKRVVRKSAGGGNATATPTKRSKANPLIASELTPANLEASLALPMTNAEEDSIGATRLTTNRAPLVLAFVVTLLKYTMPSQPLSSRLSLAQAVVSVNSRSKAINIGLLEKGTGAEEEGWGVGQPGVKIMGREIKIMRRHGYDPHEGETVKAEGQGQEEVIKPEEDLDTQSTLRNAETYDEEEPALWGLDLEALRSRSGPLIASTQKPDGSGLPIYSALNARAYIMKSFASSESSQNQGSVSKKPSASAQRLDKEENLARLLKALDLLYQSWARVLSKDDLDKRAWSWYVAVRPEVQDGQAGWGGKGEVHLQKMLDMRRKG